MKLSFKKSLKSKLSLLLLIAVILPLLATGVVSYWIASNLTEEKEKQSGMNTLQQISDKLDFIIRDVDNMSVFIIGQKDIQAYLNNGQADISLFSQNMAFLMNLGSSKKYISNITITSDFGHPTLSNTNVLHSELPELLKANELYYKSSSSWWTPLYENQTTDNGIRRVISLVRPIRSIGKYQRIGDLSISIDEAEVRRILRDAGWEKKGSIWLLYEDNRILSSQSGEDLNQLLSGQIPILGELKGTGGVMDYKAEGESNTVLYYSLPSLNWKIVGVIPTKVYTAQNEYVLTLTACAIGIAALLAIALVLYFTTWVTRPLTELSRKLKDINPDEPIPAIEVKSSDEVGLLLHSYNKLGDRIERLKSQLQQNEAVKRGVDIQALQAQINPHFLYNTLSSIHWIALMNKDKQIAEMVGTLSDFLRFSLNNGQEFCSVQQEVAHAQNYILIMSKRFQDKFDWAFYVDSDLHDRMMLKLLLQPLIENSIMHGLQKNKNKGSVYVHGERRGDAIKFVVEDTGIGMAEDKLMNIRHQLSNMAEQGDGKPEPVKSGYGLGNVHRRLQLHYGSEAGLHIESEPGSGTRISFIIPILEELS
ncbi:cache domain-containing sensor histidine kinase [Paenibacillus eucommiae]|uniref:histidine kinase n=1 Tax=Paenibacillus eucommiae TaxID=1355755 RepID=A0ABS4IZ23_9BACL|nr:histidine kinase [Paenibacillus eucommiae]MBP1992111.1 two-component system sensor histidine kinase YesM [Paenibacillus eucommiae]